MDYSYYGFVVGQDWPMPPFATSHRTWHRRTNAVSDKYRRSPDIVMADHPYLSTSAMQHSDLSWSREFDTPGSAPAGATTVSILEHQAESFAKPSKFPQQYQSPQLESCRSSSISDTFGRTPSEARQRKVDTTTSIRECAAQDYSNANNDTAHADRGETKEEQRPSVVDSLWTFEQHEGTDKSSEATSDHGLFKNSNKGFPGNSLLPRLWMRPRSAGSKSTSSLASISEEDGIESVDVSSR